MGHKRLRPSFETPRERAAPQDDGGVCGGTCLQSLSRLRQYPIGVGTKVRNCASVIKDSP
jgi:hypothetical protein